MNGPISIVEHNAAHELLRLLLGERPQTLPKISLPVEVFAIDRFTFSYSSVTHPSSAGFTVLMYLCSVPRFAL